MKIRWISLAVFATTTWSAASLSLAAESCKNCDKQIILSLESLKCVNKNIDHYIEEAKKASPAIISVVDCEQDIASLENASDLKGNDSNLENILNQSIEIDNKAMEKNDDDALDSLESWKEIYNIPPDDSIKIEESKKSYDEREIMTIAKFDPEIKIGQDDTQQKQVTPVFLLTINQLRCLKNNLPKLIELAQNPTIFNFDACSI